MSQGAPVAILFLLTLAVHGPPSAASTPDAPPSAADLQFFETKIRPVLVERCYACHSTKEGKDKGGLHVDGRAALLKGGDNGPSVVPGDPAASKLIEAVSYENVDLQMPPKGKLTDAQVADLTEWVRRGAPWPAEQGGAVAKAAAFDIAARKAEHWAWQPVKPVPPPAASDNDPATTNVDRFLLAKLAEKNLPLGVPADRRALARRAALVLTGLPPTPEQVEAFVADASPDALAKVVDRLLASPAFGERWARHWLDLVRYAETRGHEFDYDIPGAHQYRDYVIRALNADVPYDRFVTEHIAGDLLPAPRRDPSGAVNESVLGTGFWFLNEQVHSPVDIRQDECDRVDNQLDVFGKTFLGLTIGCARCHDHKFDAISAKDYYALAGFLHSSSYRDVRFEHDAHNAAVAERLRKYDAEAFGKVRDAIGDVAKLLFADHTDPMRVLEAALNQRPRAGLLDVEQGVVNAWEIELRRARGDPGHPLHPLAMVRTGDKNAAVAAAVAAAKRRRAVADRDASGGWVTVVDYAAARPGDWIADGHAFGSGPRAAGSFVPGSGPERPVAAVLPAPAAVGVSDPSLPGTLRTPTFTVSAPSLSMLVCGTGRAFVCIDSHRMVAGPLHGMSKQPIKPGDDWRVQAVGLSGYVGQRAHVEFSPGEPGTRLMVRWVKLGPEPAPLPPVFAVNEWGAAPPADAGVMARRYGDAVRASVIALGSGNWQFPYADPALGDWLARRPALLGLTPARSGGLRAAWADYEAGRKTILSEARSSAAAPAMLDGSPFNERVLIRGSHKTQGEVVGRRFLEAVDGPAPLFPESAIEAGSGRLELARRVVDPANPLTARVIVNRVWHHLFGRGIVASTDDFGVLGERPTHPELLDFLAAEFVRDGWSVKRLIRRLVLTRAWQMSSRPMPDGDRLDPPNLLLHRANLRRLEAEAIRDQMLSVSGRLDPTMFGPSAKIHLTGFMEGRGRPSQSGPLDGNGRRSLYMEIRRNFLSPMMLAFDAPQPFNTMGRRAASNVPAQALILMNDPFVVQQAALWARRALADKGASPEQRVDRMYRSAFARPPTEPELAEAQQFIEAQAAQLGVGRDDPRAWADFAHVLMNVKEFIYVP